MAVSAVKTVLLNNTKRFRISLFHRVLRTYTGAFSAADTGVCNLISLFSALTPPTSYVSLNIGFTPRLKYSMLNPLIQKTIPIFLVSPGYTFSRYGCSEKIVLIHFSCSSSGTGTALPDKRMLSLYIVYPDICTLPSLRSCLQNSFPLAVKK